MFYVQKGIKTSISSNDAIDVFASKESESKRKLLIYLIKRKKILC